MSYNKENDKLLINLVRCNTILFDISDENYKNYILKHKVWENISETMKIPISVLKKRWKHLRDHYKKKKKAATITGQGKSESTWEYMSELSFLSQDPSQRNSHTKAEVDTEIEIVIKDQLNKTYPPSESTSHEIEPKNEPISPENVSLDNVSSDRDPEETNIFLQNTEDSMAAPPIKKRKKSIENSSVTILKQNQEERARRLHKKILKSKKSKKSSIHKFFDAMADIVSEFPSHLVAEARLKVCQVVNDLEMKKNNNQFAWSSTPTQSNDSSDSWTNL